MNFAGQDKIEMAPQEIVGVSETKKEKPKVLEIPDDSEAIDKYEKGKFAISKEIEDEQKKREELETDLKAVRDILQIGSEVDSLDNPSLDLIDKKIEELRLKQIESSANFPGNWTLLLRDRMLDPVTKNKFIKTREEVMSDMKIGEIGKMDKPKQFATHYQNQIDHYDERIQTIFASTEYVLARETYDGKEAKHLGIGNINQSGTVFVDAVHDNGEPINSRQKNIVEAHEKGHGLRDFTTVDRADFRQSLDFEVIDKFDKETGARNIGYLSEAVEIAERMAQLKNYFGMNAEDIFTADHLNYAREHYVEDTGLDNNMSLFLIAVTTKTANKFIETINKYPL